MASAVTTEKLKSRVAVTQYDFDPDATTTTEIGWVDMKDFEHFLCSFFRTVGTSALTYAIIANPESDGSGTDVTVKTGSAAPDATGDYAFLECTMDELAALSTTQTYRYVTMTCAVATGTDEGVVTYIRSGAKFPRTGLTADSIA